MSSLRWYAARLAAMTPAEIVRRVSQSVELQRWRRRGRWSSPGPLTGAEPDPVPRPDLGPEWLDWLRGAAREASEGHLCLLGIEVREPDPDWHIDPHTGRRAPMSFGPTIAYWDTAVSGDSRVIWERSRCGSIVTLAAACRVLGDERHAEAAARLLESWVRANPFPSGVNWTSSLEAGMRLLAWADTERLLRGSAVHARLFGPRGTMWDSVYRHMWSVWRRRAVGSSANNHLIGEMAGLYVAATAWPVFPACGRWAASAKRVLEREARRQVFGDGLTREQAFGYQLFVAELLLQAGLAAERCGDAFSDGYRDVVRRMAEAVYRLRDVAGNLPRYGDDDEGTALFVTPPEERVDALLTLARAYSGAEVPATRAGAASLALGRTVEPASGPPLGHAEAFEGAGVYVLSTDRGKPREVLVVADAGPLGYGTLRAHGHADALGFTLSIGGAEIVADPGTYTYHAEPEWRRYFRSTAAHSTVMVDAEDQAASGGPFLWSGDVPVRVVRWSPSEGVLSAEHAGYHRLPGRPVHRRTLELDGGRLTVSDEMLGGGTHALEWRTHFHPRCEVTLGGASCSVAWETGTLDLRLDEALEWSLVRGGPGGGWYSAAFNRKAEAWTLCGRAMMTLPVRMQVSMEVDDEG